RDGSFYWLATTIVPFMDQQGKPRQYIAIHADVTERKRAEEELRATQSHLQQILEHNPAVLYESDLKGGKITPYLIAENISGLLGFTLAETLSSDWWLSQLHPEDREHAIASIPETLAHGVSRTE